MSVDRLAPRERVVGDHAEPHEHRAALGVLVDGDDERERPYEVRHYPEELLALGEGLVDEVELVVFEVTQAAVDQARRPAHRPAGYVSLAYEQDLQAPHRGVARYPRPVDAGPDDDHVERVRAYVVRDTATAVSLHVSLLLVV